MRPTVTEPNLTDQIAGAQAYEDLHVPALFEQWCPRVLDAAGVTGEAVFNAPAHIVTATRS